MQPMETERNQSARPDDAILDSAGFSEQLLTSAASRHMTLVVCTLGTYCVSQNQDLILFQRLLEYLPSVFWEKRINFFLLS